MNENKDFVEKVSHLDFDPGGHAQRRVWARLQQRPAAPRAWIRPLAWGACAALLLAAGSWIGMRWSGYLHCPAQSAEVIFPLQNAQCKKADGRFLISTQLECNGKDCSCTKTVTVCDEHPVTRVTRKTCRNTPAPADFNPQDPWNLWEKDIQQNTQDLLSCQNQC